MSRHECQICGGLTQHVDMLEYDCGSTLRTASIERGIGPVYYCWRCRCHVQAMPAHRECVYGGSTTVPEGGTRCQSCGRYLDSSEQDRIAREHADAIDPEGK